MKIKKKRRMRSAKKNADCPCESGKLYADCCRIYHTGEAVPETAEILMRSRYTAYAFGLADYIIDTTDRSGYAWEEDLEKWKTGIVRFSKNTVYAGVIVLSHEENGADATVKFCATLLSGGKDASFTEISKFRKVDGRWLYNSGEIQ